MLPGMPFVYYGEEIGMVGPKPDEMIRTPMQWSSTPNDGFTTGKPWESLQADWETKNVAAQDSSPRSLLNHYRKLIQLRNVHEALTRGPLRFVETDDRTGTIASWVRSSRDEGFLIIVNFGPRHGELYMKRLPSSLPGWGDYKLEISYMDPRNACAGYFYANRDGSFLVRSIEPHGFCVLRITQRRR